MKDKRILITFPLLIIIGILYLYFYVENPLEKVFDSGSIAMILVLSGIIVFLLYRKRSYFTKQIIGIILLLIFICIYFLI
ncbi:hypothetical protein D7D25_09950 [Proteiniphilum sp. X52]|nr:hypothetical protein D7D25_09950 [Proteiniphilum sp. X52]